MTVLWKDIEADPSFQKQTSYVKLDVAGNYFKQHIETDPSFKEQSPETQGEVRKNFMDSALSIQPVDSGEALSTQESFKYGRPKGRPEGETALGPAPEYVPKSVHGLASPEVSREMEIFGQELTEPKKYEHFGQVIGGVVQGTVEGAAAITTAVPTFIGATLGVGMGILTDIAKGGQLDAQLLADAKDVQEQVMESLTYAPSSPEGQLAAEVLALPFTLASEGVYMIAKDELGATEDQARAAQFLLDVALIAGPKIKKGLKRAGTDARAAAQMPKEVRESIVELGTEKLREAPETPISAPKGIVAGKTPAERVGIPVKATPDHLAFLEETFDVPVERGGRVFGEVDRQGMTPEVFGYGSDSITNRWTEGGDFSKAQAKSAIKAALGKSKKKATERQNEIVAEIVERSKEDFDLHSKREVSLEWEVADGQRVKIDDVVYTKETKNGEVFLKNGETIGPLPESGTIRVDQILPEGTTLFEAEKAKAPRVKPTQQDMIGAREGLEGRVPAEQAPIEAGALFDVEGRKQTKAQAEAAKRQQPLSLASEEGAVTIRRTPIRDAMDAERSPAANKVQKVFDEQRLAKDAAGKMKPGTWLGKLNRAIVDVSGNAKNRLLKEAGAEGKKAVMEHDLIAGASAKANMEVGTVIDAMTKGLTREQYEYMNDYIQAKRALAISKYKKDFKHAGDIKSHEYVQWMEKLPEEVRVKLEERSQVFFDTMQKKLGELRDEGLINEESYQSLVEKGDYAPRRLQEYLEVEDSGQFGGKKISVESSGIKRLKEGDIGLLENDAELMLREVVGRFEHRIARNRANRALYDIAKADPKNTVGIEIGKVKTEFLVKSKGRDVVLRKFFDPEKAREAKNKYKNPDKYEIVRRDTPKDKLPPNKDYVNVVIDGKTVPLVLDREFARDWVSRETVVDPNVANLIQWASGSKILRPMATGINPEFAITNLPRDMARALVVSEEFSPHMPVGLAQLGREMATVTADTFARKGRYKDFINEGGGMSFLTHQGQTFGKPGSGLSKVTEYLGYLGESSEIMVRLAIRERAIRNRLKQEGKVSPERMKEIQREATYEARNQLDFAQGGWLTKAADNAIPYLNAAVQGTRGMFRAAKNNPARFTYQMAQIGALSVGLYHMNNILNKEAYSQVSDRDKANNFIFTTPFWYKDKQGNKRYYVGKIAKDQSQRVFAAIFEGLAAKADGEDVNEDMIVQTITDLTPVGPGDFLPPTGEAVLGYTANKDFWRNEDIWKSKYAGEVAPEEEYTTYTHPFFIQAGQATGMSPERLRFALSQVFTHRNIYTDMGGYIWKQTMDNMPEDDQEKVSEEIMLRKPGIRKFFARTDPYYAEEKHLKEAKMEASTKRLKQNRELDSLSQQYINKTITGPDLINFINKQEPTDRRRLLDRHKRRVKLQDLPNRRWWLDVAEMDPESRAQEFYRVYKDSSKKERQEMRFNAQKVPGMTSERFRSKVIRLMREGKNNG
jgi:hypothetical protein